MSTTITYPTSVLQKQPEEALWRHSEEVLWRRRLVLVTVLMFLLVGVWAVIGSSQASNPEPSRSFDAVVVRVQPGDSLWRIATEINPTADRRQLVDALAEIAGSVTIQPGQQLIIPTRLLQ